MKSLMPLLLGLLVLLNLAVCLEIDKDEVIMHKRGGEIIGFNGILIIRWNYESPDQIRFDVTANATGWVGMGLNYRASMAGTDFAIGFQRSDGGFDLQDRYSDLTDPSGHAQPIPDIELGGNDDFLNVTGSAIEGQVSYSFSRKIHTQDRFDNVIDATQMMYVLYAYGTVRNDEPVYHGSSNRRAVSVFFTYP